jgi:PKD domain
MSPRGLALAVASAGVAAFAAVSPAAAQAKFIGITPDVPSGTHADIAMNQKAPVLPYNGGRVVHSNRTHPIFWEPAGSGLTFDPGYESLIQTFLIDVAADSHRTTNVYSLSGQYTDSNGPAAYDSTYGGAVVDNDPLPPNGCTEPATGPGWTVCLTDAQLETELEQVIAADHLPTTNHDVYFIVTPDGFGSCTDSGSSSCALGGSENGYCGYHSETPNGIVYAVIPYNAVPGHCQSSNPRPNSSPADPTVSTISHEHNEMDTDPDDNAWIDARGEEEADLCLTNYGPSLGGPGGTAWNESIHGGHFFLQEEWSNADGACEPRAQPDSVSFAQVSAPDRARSMSFTGRASAPHGGIVGFQWFFGDGRTAFGRRVSHTFKAPGTFRVRLRATDSWDNWASAGRTIRVNGRPAG